MRLFRWLLLTLTALLPLGCSRKEAPTWPEIKGLIRERFPEVRQLSTRELDTWLHSDSEKPILLDARAPEEYAVSHLPGARLAADDESTQEALSEVGKEQRIVVYCSVGYRSSALAQRLQAQGYTQVYNLEGSIFAWANEGRPVYQDTQPVQQVHPYDRKWGQLLHPALWSALPD